MLATCFRKARVLFTNPNLLAILTSNLQPACFGHCNSFSVFRSCRIYCDACGDEESGFLPPLARIAEWDRGSDLQNPGSLWPDVVVDLLELNLDCFELQAEIKSLQQRLDPQKLVYFGLPVRRDFGNTELDELGHLKIETNAGWQTVVREFWLSEVPDFADAFDTIQSTINEFGQPADLRRWVERYDKSPEELADGDSWHWNYTRPNSEPNSGITNG